MDNLQKLLLGTILRKCDKRSVLLCVVTVMSSVFGTSLNAREIEVVEDISYYKELIYPARERHYVSIAQSAYSLYASGEEISDSLVIALIPKSRIEFWQWTVMFNPSLLHVFRMKDLAQVPEDWIIQDYRNELNFFIHIHNRQLQLSTESLECFVAYLAYARYTEHDMYDPNALCEIDDLIEATLVNQVVAKENLDRLLYWYEFFVYLLERKDYSFYRYCDNILELDAILDRLSIESSKPIDGRAKYDYNHL